MDLSFTPEERAFREEMRAFFHKEIPAPIREATQRGEPSLVRPATGLLLLILVQIGLGAGTWVTKYGWPAWFADYGFAAGYTVVADSREQAWITTAHVAAGSLILATSLLLALRSVRFACRNAQAASHAEPLLMKAAR